MLGNSLAAVVQAHLQSRWPAVVLTCSLPGRKSSPPVVTKPGHINGAAGLLPLGTLKPGCECRTLIAHGAFGSWAVADGLCPLDWDAQHGALTQSARAAPPATTGRNPHRRRQCRRRPTPARTTNVQTSRTPTIPHIKRIKPIEPPNRPRPRREASRRTERNQDWRRTSTARIGGPSRFR